MIVYHEVKDLPFGTAMCLTDDQENCLGQYDVAKEQFEQQMDYLDGAGMAPDVVPAGPAFKTAQTEIHGPVAGSLSLTPAAPTTHETVTVTPAGFTDPDGDAVTYHYQWLVNGQAVAGATGASLDLAKAGNGDAGDTLTVKVHATDPDGNASTTTETSVTVAPAVDPGPGNGGTGTGGAGGTGGTGTTGTTPPATTAPVTTTPPATTPPATTPAADRKAPTVALSGRTKRHVAKGTKVTVRFSCSDASGVAACGATIGRSGHRAKAVRSGAKVRLTRAGTYVVTLSATDRAGNVRTKRYRIAVKG